MYSDYMRCLYNYIPAEPLITLFNKFYIKSPFFIVKFELIIEYLLLLEILASFFYEGDLKD